MVIGALLDLVSGRINGRESIDYLLMVDIGYLCASFGTVTSSLLSVYSSALIVALAILRSVELSSLFFFAIFLLISLLSFLSVVFFLFGLRMEVLFGLILGYRFVSTGCIL